MDRSTWKDQPFIMMQVKDSPEDDSKSRVGRISVVRSHLQGHDSLYAILQPCHRAEELIS